MGLVVVTGGARCGKSAIAQALAASSCSPVTVAVFGAGEGDIEMTARIERHRAERPDGWTTVEAQDSVEWTGRVGGGTLLVDCAGTLLAMVMAEADAEFTARGVDMSRTDALPDGYAEEVEHRFAPLLGWMTRRIDDTVVVTNEVGDGVVPAYTSGRVFRDVLGRGNRALVDRAQAAYLVVAGRCIDLSSLPREILWPSRTDPG